MLLNQLLSELFLTSFFNYLFFINLDVAFEQVCILLDFLEAFKLHCYLLIIKTKRASLVKVLNFVDHASHTLLFDRVYILVSLLNDSCKLSINELSWVLISDFGRVVCSSIRHLLLICILALLLVELLSENCDGAADWRTYISLV